MSLVELIWDRKYDGSGNKSAPVSLFLPFQTIETLNESSEQRQRSIESFLTRRAEVEWRNRLIWGDKKYVLPSLLPEFANSINLIYIDPPFDTGADFSYLVEVPDHQVDTTSFTKLPSVIEQKAYRDTWGQGLTHLDSYLRWFSETLFWLEKLLKSTGSIYIHLDSHVSHYIKILMDEVFGPERFLNEISWRRGPAHNDPSRYGRNKDTILFYSKSENWTWNSPKGAVSDQHLESFRGEDENGKFTTQPLHGPAHGQKAKPWRGIYPPPGRVWAYKTHTLDALDKSGLVVWSKGRVPRVKKYLHEMTGAPLQEIWADIPILSSHHKEHTGFPTQKPEALLERIIKASSIEGDLVLDCFCGSGTTAAVAEKMKRRWIACDLSRFAVHTTRKRLLGVEGVEPFVIQNLGKYERQAWQTAEFGESTTARTRSYVDFILRLYNAQPLNGYIWLHGKSRNRLVHVGSVDSPISPLDVGQIVAEFRRSIGTGKDAPRTNGVDVLGWDFAFEINELAKQQAAQANVDVRFMRIPREVLDRRAIEQGDVHFFELASLDASVKASGRKAAITINDFVIPADDVPADIQKEIKHWSQWIDYWAVDWNNRNDTFHNEWQEYRTVKKPQLTAESSRIYDEPGEYRVVIKVVDILGNDTTKMLQVKIS